MSLLDETYDIDERNIEYLLRDKYEQLDERLKKYQSEYFWSSSYFPTYKYLQNQVAGLKIKHDSLLQKYSSLNSRYLDSQDKIREMKKCLIVAFDMVREVYDESNEEKIKDQNIILEKLSQIYELVR